MERRGVVIELLSDGVKVKWMNKSVTEVTQHTWIQEDKDGKASRTQIPLILAWSYTIHKAQGCTLDYAVCDIGPSIFGCGQAYVALSRVRSTKGLFLLDFYPASIKADASALQFVNCIKDENGAKKSKKISKSQKMSSAKASVKNQVKNFNGTPSKRLLGPNINKTDISEDDPF